MTTKTLSQVSFQHHHPTLDPLVLPTQSLAPKLIVDINKASPSISKTFDIDIQRRLSRPEPSRTWSSPPASPTRNGPYAMSSELRTLHAGKAITPPPTPTKLSHEKTASKGSAISDWDLKHGDLFTSHTLVNESARTTLVNREEEPGSTALREFSHWVFDYTIPDKKKPLGSGLWSEVYRAFPILSKPPPTFGPKSTGLNTPGPAGMTPPLTPVKSCISNPSKADIPTLSSSFAIKTPAIRSAQEVLAEEARILSYLSRFPDFEKHVVPFYGQDTRNGALVLKAMDETLESWIENTLNMLPEPARAERLIQDFPTIALRLLEGLEWISERDCMHADIKPSNFLLSFSDDESIKHVVYSDFSSAVLCLPSIASTTASKQTTSATPLGGGTWDFLDPGLVSRTSPIELSPTTDLWALAITLLIVILGSSPYDCAGSNQFRKREFVKQGSPMAYIGYGDSGPRNLARLDAASKKLSFNLHNWFSEVLINDPSKRVGVGQWKEELEGAVRKLGISKI